jgi:uncharacterized protein (TIGR03382 family)
MTRLVPVILLVMLATSRVASADTGMLPDGATLTFDKLYIQENGDFKEPLDPDVRRYYFNLAHCVCSKANAGNETKLQYLLKLDRTITPTIPAEFWVGTGCETDESRNNTSMCRQLTTPQLSDIKTVAMRETRPEFSLYDVIVGPNAGQDCPKDEGKVKPIFLLADTDGMSGIDYSLVKNIGQPPGDTAAGVDTNPPPALESVTARPSDGGIVVSWTVPISRATDIYAYQALCAGPDGDAIRTGAPKARYVTSQRVCQIADAPLTQSQITSGPNDAPVTTLPPRLAELDPAFICGEQLTGTADRLQISGLENGTPYTVVLIATDLYGNFVGTYFTSTITPQPATDFWEDIHDRGSSAEGGFCMVARSTGDGGTLTGMLAVVAAAGWLVRRRRSTRGRGLQASMRSTALAAGVVMLLWSASSARAGGYQPYWENTDPDGEAELVPGDPALVQWHAGIRIGPYVPDIDAQFATSPGPYEQMFGGSRIMPMLDVDRILWTSFGQLGLGASIGYMQKSANAFVDGSDPNDPNRPRSPGDENTFRLLPLALTATYRFTQLDDLYGIPVVPYARGGLAYYIWWLQAEGSAVCKDGGMPPDCEENPPRGGSLGFTGSVGIAIRAERVDPSTAMSMQQSGIQHAGIYAELSLAKVDGFGSETKLSVGDSTWFAGVNFEF